MEWEVEYTDEFGGWWQSLQVETQESITASVGLLERLGPRLGYPHTSSIKSSKHDNMRELRVQHRGNPIRVFYAFDPRRIAVLLLGDDKTGDDRWYERMVPVADRLYDEHMETLQREGLIDE